MYPLPFLEKNEKKEKKRKMKIKDRRVN